jgi:hypothetical protein
MNETVIPANHRKGCPAAKWVLKLVGTPTGIMVNTKGHGTAGFVISFEWNWAGRH